MNMKILFVTGLYPKEFQEQLRELSGNRLQNAPNVFQWSIVEGLFDNDCDFDVVSFPFLPSYPLKFSHLYTPSAPIMYKGKNIGDMLSYNALAVYKYYSIKKRLKSYVELWIERNKSDYSQLVVLTYTSHPSFVEAIVESAKKCANIKIVSIITDLVDNMSNFSANRSLLKRIQCNVERIRTKAIYKHIDNFILLTKAMEEKIPEAVACNMVLEGLAPCNNYERKTVTNREYTTFFYAGSLDEFTCVGDLVNAFMLIRNPRCKLIICGDGALKSYIVEMADKDKRIEYLGMVPREISVKFQKQATCLVNPRKPNGDITKYSFPSKTIEYMISGTPMIGYKLEGIPKEYHQHMYIPKDLSNESLAEMMVCIADTDQLILNNKADEANKFIVQNKTSFEQVKRIIQFVRG